MIRRARWTVIALLPLACGGQARRESNRSTAAGGAASSDLTAGSGGTSVLGSNAESGAASAEAGAESGAAGGESGAPGYVSLIDSDTRDCPSEDYCFGLACYAPPSFAPRVCLARCATDADCQPFETCLQAPKLEPTCYALCDSPADCYGGFDCFDFSGTGGKLVCFPATWTQDRDRLGY